MRRSFAILFAFVVASAAFADDADLYYAADKPFSEKRTVEFRLGAGMLTSNPYLTVRTLQFGAYYLVNPYLAVGAEGSLHDTSYRESAKLLQTQLAKSGQQLDAVTPKYSYAGVVRFTPVSGLVNLLSKKVVKADISLVARAGMSQYDPVGMSPLVGGGIDIHLGFTNQFGLHTSFFWNAENLRGTGWQWQNGFLIGPSVRF